MQLNIKKTQSKTGQETYIGISPEKAYRWPTTHEKMLNITIRETLIKTTKRYRLTPARIAVNERSTYSAGEGVVTRKPSHAVGGNINQ